MSKSAKLATAILVGALIGLPASAMAQNAEPPTVAEDAAGSSPAPAPVPAPAESIPSIDDVLGNLANISPFNLVYVFQQYWDAGDKLKAAFWFYIWQLRTGPWAELDPETAQVRAALNQQAGMAINGWLAADPELMIEVAQRASGYEAKLPLWSRRPDGIAEDFWINTIAQHRAAYAAEMADTFATTTPDQIRTLRAEAGMPVGTPADLGAPLPDDWR